MAAAYGLYTHIQSNQRRSIALLLGLFFLVYVMVFAGALAAEGLMYDASLDWLLRAAWRDLIYALPWATGGTLLWILIAYRFHQSLIDSRDRRPRGHPQGTAAALQSAREPLHLARHPDAEAQGDGERRAQRLRQRAQPEAIRHHRHHRPAGSAGRRRGRGGARPRADAHPQRRRPHAGDRRDHRRRDRLFRRTGVPDAVPGRLAVAAQPFQFRRQRQRQGRRLHRHRDRDRA